MELGMKSMNEKMKALKAAFPGTIPVMTGYLFLGMAFGILLQDGIPELIATVFIVIVHRWKKNVLLSIAGGTLLYMMLVQLVFI